VPSQPTPKPPATVRLAGLTRFPVEADASRRDAQRVVNENLRAAERFALTGAPVSADAAIAAIEAGLAMVPQPVQQQQGAARRSISWAAAQVELRADRSYTRPEYRLKWVLSRGAWLAYQPVRSGQPTELLGMVQTGTRSGAVAIQFLYGGAPVEVATFPFDQNGRRAAMLALEARVAENPAA
jgi:hypothetical protein